MSGSILDKIAKEGDQPFTLALLFNSAPLELAGLLSDSTLNLIDGAKTGTLDDYARQILSSEIASRAGKDPAPLRLRLLGRESPFCFPVVFSVADSIRGRCRPADVQLFCLQSNHQTPVQWPEDFRQACEQAITLADMMVPGNDRPWARPCMPELVREMGQPSGALAFFFAAMCFLLDLPYPGRVICSAQLKNGRFAPVKSIADKARIAQQDGFSFFVVCGEQNRIEAEQATRPPKGTHRKLTVLALSEGNSPGDQFLELISGLTRTGQVWNEIDLNSLVDFLMNRALLVARKNPFNGVTQLTRIQRILRCLPEPGLDNTTDSLRLDVLGALGAFSIRCRFCGQAEQAFDELQSICARLLHKRQCPANFEDHWFALPLNRGLLAMHGYDYGAAKKALSEAEKQRSRRWPPSAHFEGLILQAQGRLHLMQGQTDAAKAKAAPAFFRKAAIKLYPAQRSSNDRYLAEALIQLGRFSAARACYARAMKGRPEDQALATASRIRALTLEGVIRRNGELLIEAEALAHAYRREGAQLCVPPWPMIASIYAALAAATLYGAKKSLHLLLAIENPPESENEDARWLAPTHSLAPLWIAWLAAREHETDLLDRAIGTLDALAESMAPSPMDNFLAKPIKELHHRSATEWLPSFRALITRIQYGVPETLVDAFLKNL